MAVEEGKEVNFNQEEAISKLKELDFVVSSTNDFNTLVENKADGLFQTKKQEIINGRTAEVATELDGILFEKTGIEKQPNEKWHAYTSRVLESISNEKAELSSKVKNDVSLEDALLKQSEGWKEKEESYLTQLKEQESKFAKTNKINSFKGELSEMGMTLIDIPESTLKRELNAAFNELDAESTYSDGKVQFIDADGNLQQNKDNLHNPFTVKEKLQEKLAHLIKKEKVVKGVNGKPDSTPTTAAVDVVIAREKPSNYYELQTTLKKHFAAQGKDTRSPEYVKAYSEYKTKLNLSA